MGGRKSGSTDPRRALRRTVGLVAAVAGAVMAAASLLSWITTPMETSGRITISGWGDITGGNPMIDGSNLNVLMSGIGSYRPGVPGLVAGALALTPALIVAATGDGQRPNRVAGVVLGLCGLVGGIWGVARVTAPGDAVGVLPGGLASPGWGPWLTGLAGLVLVAAAVAVLAGLLDPRYPGVRTGVQGSGR